ncbi:MAG: MFS transporter [Rhizomicrobium sp.]|nr:MFS transporter [Rhizomicrobium sp.]
MNTKPSSLIGRISFGEKIGYSLGDAASNLYWKTFEFYLMIFYTDVFGISAAAIGTMLLVTRLADAVADPIMGSIADRTITRWGHFRPYLIWFAVPLAVAGVLTFSTPHLSGGGKVIYAYITYSLLMFLYTAVNIPYTALMGVMTSNSLERTAISSIRFIGAFTAGIFVQYLTPSFVRLFGHGNDVLGWQMTMVLYGVLAVAMLILCFATTRERVAPPPQQKSDLSGDLKALVGSRSWQVLIGVLLLVLAAFAIKGSDSAYYFKYFVQNEKLLPPFLVSNGLAFVAAVSVASYLAKIFGKKALFMFAIGAGGLVIGGFWMVGPADIAAIFALQIVSSFIIGFNSPLVFAMFADVADEAEWRAGRRNTGLVFASAIFSTKAGWAIGAWMFGLLLSYFGYIPNVAQTARSLFGIILATSWVPCLLLLAAAALMQLYPLTEAQMVKIEGDLELRRAKASETPTS